MTVLRVDYDTPWKEIVEQYFPEFLAFFFPQAYAAIDWERGYSFLDKELRQIVREAESGSPRRVDKLARVFRHGDGAEVWVLIHIEIQGQPEKAFDERMYIYNYRTFDRYKRRVASLAVLTDSNPDWRPGSFGYELFGCRVSLDFPIVKLLDYRVDWDELLKSDNPFAVVTMAHLQTQATRHDVAERYAVKLRLAKMLYQKGYDRREIINLFRFIAWVMALPPELEDQFMNDVIAYEKEENIPYMAPFELKAFQEGMEQGMEQGVEQGMERGAQQMLLAALDIRFGPLSEELMERVQEIKDTAVLQELHRQALLVDSLEAFTAHLPEA
ncbi:MAG TPA: hypothetical protein ENJ93_01115 [Chloroflexi bacterium]|nr:hypothetical protein [Chloroflexota bacterium]